MNINMQFHLVCQQGNTVPVFENQPVNKNLLPVVAGRFVIKRLPTTLFFLQKFNLPGVTLPSVEVPSPLVEVPYAGDHVDYEPLRIRFMVDEDLKNWLEIHDWIRGLGFPEEYEEYAALATPEREKVGLGVSCDATLSQLTAKRRWNADVEFWGLVPISLSGIDYDSTGSETEYVYADAQFRYTLYKFSR